jgi:hypothetical protein
MVAGRWSLNTLRLLNALFLAEVPGRLYQLDRIHRIVRMNRIVAQPFPDRRRRSANSLGAKFRHSTIMLFILRIL